VLDIPLLSNESARGGPIVAASATPWPGVVVVGAGGEAASAIERARLVRPALVGELLWDLYPGPVGRWDDGNYVAVRLVGQGVQAVSKADLLGGANTLAVETAGGAWEVLQFREAAMVSPDVYEIRGLLRGQLGTEAAQGAPTAAGARVVGLSAGVGAAPLADHEWGVTLEWRFAPRSQSFLDAAAGAATAVYARADLRPLSPVHLAARRQSGDLVFTWRRRTRIGGDDWASPDVPLGEDAELYRFELLDDDDHVVLSRDVSAAQTIVTAAEEASVLPGGPHYAFRVRIAQVSAAYGAGARRSAFVYL
jgi:hypothetical protein